MRTLKLLLIFSVMFIAVPARAADKAALENTEPQEKESPPERAERPQREAVKLSPRARESAPRPDESGNMKREAPPRAESPLQNVPALMDPPPGGKAPSKP
ncbi:MAG: hypothetical protein HY082_00105 [Gammaproteobacteria bacterium]|nr:hypothetical protein [Gammaproteobacteria bacterium]